MACSRFAGTLVGNLQVPMWLVREWLESHDDFIGREFIGPIHSFINSIRIKTSNSQHNTHTSKAGYQMKKIPLQWIPLGNDTTSVDNTWKWYRPSSNVHIDKSHVYMHWYRKLLFNCISWYEMMAMSMIKINMPIALDYRVTCRMTFRIFFLNRRTTTLSLYLYIHFSPLHFSFFHKPQLPPGRYFLLWGAQNFHFIVCGRGKEHTRLLFYIMDISFFQGPKIAWPGRLFIFLGCF